MEKALLVHLSTPRDRSLDAEESMQELRGLTESAGAEVMEELFQRRSETSPKYLIGSGKVSELTDLVLKYAADMVVFDHVLTPIQQKNLEDQLETKVIDRSQLILDIFSQRAHSREGKLQVELAQLQYMLPRLTGKGTALSRLGGGIGTRGPGEKKLEQDRRRIQKRITSIKASLSRIQKHRVLQRKGRQTLTVPQVSLVGYTNAGKSTLFNQLTQENRFASDQLFATLDPVLRRVHFSDGSSCFLSDTVGLIKQLPKELKTAFRATMEQITDADCLCHVVDITSPHYIRQIEAVAATLSDLGAGDIPTLTVHNKIDRLPVRPSLTENNQGLSSPLVYVSARTGEGLLEFKNKLRQTLYKEYDVYHLRLPKTEKNTIQSFPRWAIVLKRREKEQFTELKVLAKPTAMLKFSRFIERGDISW
jgi:GTP-binding protein HflX